MRPFSWGLGTGRDVEVNGTPVKGSFGARPQVASLFWCSSRVLLSTDTPLGSSMGSTMTSWVIGSRKSSGTGSALESEKTFVMITHDNELYVFRSLLPTHKPQRYDSANRRFPLGDGRDKESRGRWLSFTGLVDSLYPLQFLCAAAARRPTPHRQGLEAQRGSRPTEGHRHAELRHGAQGRQPPAPQLLLPAGSRVWRRRRRERGTRTETWIGEADSGVLSELTTPYQFKVRFRGAGVSLGGTRGGTDFLLRLGERLVSPPLRLKAPLLTREQPTAARRPAFLMLTSFLHLYSVIFRKPFLVLSLIRTGADFQPLAGLSLVHTPRPQLHIQPAQLHLETKLQRHLRAKEKGNFILA